MQTGSSPRTIRLRPSSAWDRWNRLGVRARVTLLFGLGALLLSVLMGCLSFFTVRQFLVSDQENAARKQAYASAALLVRSGLNGPPTGSADCVRALKTLSGTNSVLYCDDQWYATAIGGKNSLPASLRTLVLSGHPASQTTAPDGTPEIAVGLPVPAYRVDYFEVTSLADLAHTLRILALALMAGGAVTTILGAIVGRSASVRSLRPLTAVSRAAVAIAGGRLDTRLQEAPDDPDLAGLTASFNRMVDQLQERIEREARFSSDVSHELRSPLTTLAASVGVLESDADHLTPRARSALELLAADLRRFQRMVDDLLEVSRFDTGSADVFLEEVDPKELVVRSVASWAAGRRNVPDDQPPPAVEMGPSLGDLRILVDKRRFERVMTNLLDNAALYGGGATRILVDHLLDRGGHDVVQVAVEDDGQGISPDERAKVFERFYRGQASGRRGAGTGTGLGLSLVAEHTRLLAGRVWVEEAGSGGARFVVELPADLAPAHDEVGP